MEQDTEIKQLINHIPYFSDYGASALLQISLPTTSEVSPGNALEIIQKYAYNKGWKPENVSIIRIGGYIACDDCKRSLHIHIATHNANYCMNCEHLNKRRMTNADVRVIDD